MPADARRSVSVSTVGSMFVHLFGVLQIVQLFSSPNWNNCNIYLEIKCCESRT